MKIEFRNGSIIEYYKSTSNCRGKRSELITFHCVNCDKVHVDYPIKDLMVFGEESLITMCRQSFENILKPYINY